MIYISNGNNQMEKMKMDYLAESLKDTIVELLPSGTFSRVSVDNRGSSIDIFIYYASPKNPILPMCKQSFDKSALTKLCETDTIENILDSTIVKEYNRKYRIFNK